MHFKKTIYFSILILLTACGGGSYPPVENSLDAGRQFIDAIYKGNFKRAGQLMVDDTKNQDLLRQKLEDDYHSRNSTDRNNLGLSSINIRSVKNMADSVTFIDFTNNYNNKPVVLKVIKQNQNWLIDLKYTNF